MGNVFENIVGSITYTAKYTGTIASPVTKHITLKIAAAGTDPNPASYPILLKLTVDCRSPFVRSP